MSLIPLTLDASRGVLLGPSGEVELRPQAYRLLLVERYPEVLSKDELIDGVWGTTKGL